MTLLINGRIETQLPMAQRAMDYGDGIFETMRYENSVVALWPYHLSRLMRGAEQLGIDQDKVQIEEEMQLMLQQLQTQNQNEGIIKLRLIRGGDQRGYAPQSNLENWRMFECHSALPLWGQSERALVCDLRLALQPQLAGIKHLNRLEQVMAAREVAKAGALSGSESDSGAITAGIMLDRRDMLRCGVDSNLFVELDGLVFTPSIQQSGVLGVFRSYAIDMLKQMGVSVMEQDMDLSILAECSGVWLTNAVKGIRSVDSVLGVGQWSYADSSALSEFQNFAAESLQVTNS